MGGFSAPSPDRRRSLRHKVHAPAFVSFDGVTGGMILDLSEQGMAMQAAVPVESQKPLHLQLKLAEPPAFMETDGYVAWADALGRAGVRFSDLPEEARQRLDDWLEHNASTPSRKAPTLSFGELPGSGPERKDLENKSLGFRTVNLEWDTFMAENKTTSTASSTIQYQFNSLGSDLNAALRMIGNRARSLTRGDSAAIALSNNGSLVCRASIGANAPPIGCYLDVSAGFSGECIRRGKALRCDDAEVDTRVDLDSCRRLGVRSLLRGADPI